MLHLAHWTPPFAGFTTRVHPHDVGSDSRSHEGSIMTSIVQDVRFGIRMLFRDPALAVLTIATLALGIGATVAVFSVVWQVLLAPLPFPDSDRLMVVWETNPNIEYPRMAAAPPNVDDWARESRLFESFGVYTSATYTLSDGQRSEGLEGAQVTASLMTTVGVAPIAGRALTAADQANAAVRPILISERIWREWFGGDFGVIGRRVRVSGRNAEVAGSCRHRFSFHRHCPSSVSHRNAGTTSGSRSNQRRRAERTM
jgi:putative ABC transport system permease protein